MYNTFVHFLEDCNMKLKIFLIFLYFLFPQNLFSTVVTKLNLRELTEGSDLILRGIVVDKVVRGYEKDGNIKIETEYEFKVREVFKGEINTKKTFSLILPGGKYKKWEMKILGMPSFNKNEEVILFLEKTPDGYIPTGLSQGKFSIIKDKNNKLKVKRNLEGLRGFKFDNSGRFIHSEFEIHKGVSLDLFINEIRSYIDEEKKK